jgi:hypothetical protein
VNTFSGLVHTARHTTKVGNTRSRWPNHLEGAVEGGARDWGEVVIELRPSSVTAREKLGCLLETPQASRTTRKSDNVSGDADNQQGSRLPEPLSGDLTPQRPHAELLERSLEGEVSENS